MKDALLWSGGIGDFLHYLTRLDAALAELPRGSVIWVESSRPAELRNLFRRVAPDVEVRFVPGRLHWTRTVPLLSHADISGRRARPARRLVEREGFRVVDEWFLPTDAERFDRDTGRVRAAFGSAERRWDTVVSLRDKGALWWPSPQLVQEAISAGTAVALGSSSELSGYEHLEKCMSSPDVASALLASAAADLYIGSDTGLATVRELLGRPNVYCVERGWRERWMDPYGYWPVGEGSASRFAHSPDELRDFLQKGRAHRERPRSEHIELFVYGTLMAGQVNHGVLEGAEFLRVAHTAPRHALHDLGEYPAMADAGEVAVQGEVYRVSLERLGQVDEFEDHPNLFCRTPVELIDRTWVHAYVASAALVRGFPSLPDGTWGRQPNGGSPMPGAPALGRTAR